MDDLAWLGLGLSEAAASSERTSATTTRARSTRSSARGLVYPCFCRRGEIARANGGRAIPTARRCIAAPAARFREAKSQDARPPASAPRCASMRRARCRGWPSDLAWREFGEGARETIVAADPGAWGDFVLRGKDTPAAYHLAVVVDDASQGISDVVRGRDLYAATSIHRLLQSLLGLAPPRYRHHRLVLDAEGAKMSKSASSQPLRALREEGYSALEVRAALGFAEPSRSRLVVRFS